MNNKVDFDEFTEVYLEKTQAQTSFFNKSRDYFDVYKIKLFKEIIGSSKNMKILDFGCGIGLCLGHLVENFRNSKIFATDISKKSLDAAKEKHSDVNFLSIDEIKNYKFDLIFMAGVLHHVELKDRNSLISDLNSILNINGKIFITEHNPFNPITRRIVSNCEYDKDAILLKKKNLIKLLKNNNFSDVDSGYYLFFPELLKFFRFFEKYLRWLPLGGQYFVSAKKI